METFWHWLTQVHLEKWALNRKESYQQNADDCLSCSCFSVTDLRGLNRPAVGGDQCSWASGEGKQQRNDNAAREWWGSWWCWLWWWWWWSQQQSHGWWRRVTRLDFLTFNEYCQHRTHKFDHGLSWLLHDDLYLNLPNTRLASQCTAVCRVRRPSTWPTVALHLRYC